MPSLLQRLSHKNQILQLENQAAGVLREEEMGDELWLTVGLGNSTNRKTLRQITDRRILPLCCTTKPKDSANYKTNVS